MQTITQNWNGTPHIWAQFDYGTKLLNYSFTGITTIDGPANNTNLSVLTRVITSDGARHTFAYNGWGIAEDFFLYGEADNQRSFLDYGFPAPGPIADCPRFGQRDDNIFGWGGAVYNVTTGFGRVTSTFQFDPNETWGQVTTPDGVVHKELFSATGGTRGLTTGMETWVSGVKTKWTATTWQSDGTNYPFYPRVIATDVYDDVNGNSVYDAGVDNYNHTAQSYTTFTKTQAQSTMPYTVYLPLQTTQYDASGTTVYRYTQTDYVDNSNYWDRRIIGLPSEQRLYDGGNVLQAKTAFSYDQLGLAGFGTTPVQFDATNYSSSFVWRGNLTNTKRYSVVSGTAGTYTETKAYYFITGSVADTYDAVNRHTLFDYQDSFATYADDASNTETVKTLTNKAYAYPTYIQDPGGYVSTLKYWYDTGAPTKTVNPKGAAAISIYEMAHGRLLKAKNLVNSAYTRYIYAADHNSAQSLTTVNSTSIETSNITVFDGIGRTRVQVGEHPGSTGKSSSAYQVYDIMGRVAEWSNPTEIDNTWMYTGDDASGYKYSRQEYDWKGRPTITYNQDYNASTNPLSKRQISYTGCGCAGGQITTVTDEMQRVQKAYADFLGRTFKTEIYNGASVYSTQLTTFNVRDQVTQSSLIAGTNGTNQNITSSYDGYGRLWKQKNPLQTTDTMYEYFNDDQLMRVTDARGAATNYAYNNMRGLLSGISYDVPINNPAPSNPLYVAPVSPVNFTYDEVGNRLTMTDGIGSITYVYDTLSRMTSETRTITELNKSYTLSYDYNLIGAVKQVSFASPSFPNDNVTTNYELDKTGRLAGINGTAFAGVTQYASQIKYRAFDAVKALTYGNNLTSNANYTMRMQLQGLNLKRPDSVALTNKNYTYYNDGRLKFADDLINEDFDRAYQWDFATRLQDAMTGSQARNFNNGLPLGTDVVPYRQTTTYNVWGNRLTQTGKVWGNDINQTETYNAQTLRHDGWTYDNAGQVVNNSQNALQYDAAGRNISFGVGAQLATQQHDGDGKVVRQDQVTTEPVFYLNSSVLNGKVIAEINGMSPQSIWVIPRGGKLNSYVYAGETRVAKQYVQPTSPPSQVVVWDQIDPLTATKTGVASNNSYQYINSRSEPDISGIEVGNVDPATLPPPPPELETPDYFGGGNTWNPSKPQYSYNGMAIDEQYALDLLGSHSGAATLDPKYQHDSATLHAAGILWHWQKNAETNLSDRFVNGLWTLGGSVEAGQSQVVDGILHGSQGSSSKGDGKVKPQSPLISTCVRMSVDAQRFADQALNSFPKATNRFRLQIFNRLFGRFTYGANFEEGPLGFIGNSKPFSGRVHLFGVGREYQGQDGFDPRFYDKDSIKNGKVNLNWDQVHHVGAYLSAALAGHKFAPSQARNEDTADQNWGDVYLADQSTALGWYLRLHPKQLSNIGNLMSSAICDGKAVPTK